MSVFVCMCSGCCPAAALHGIIITFLSFFFLYKKHQAKVDKCGNGSKLLHSERCSVTKQTAALTLEVNWPFDKVLSYEISFHPSH